MKSPAKETRSGPFVRCSGWLGGAKLPVDSRSWYLQRAQQNLRSLVVPSGVGPSECEDQVLAHVTAKQHEFLLDRLSRPDGDPSHLSEDPHIAVFFLSQTAFSAFWMKASIR